MSKTNKKINIDDKQYNELLNELWKNATFDKNIYNLVSSTLEDKNNIIQSKGSMHLNLPLKKKYIIFSLLIEIEI